MGAFKYYVTRDGGSGVFKQGGASVQIYAPPHYALVKVVLRVNPDCSIYIFSRFTDLIKSTKDSSSYTYTDETSYEGVMGARIFEHSLPPV